MAITLPNNIQNGDSIEAAPVMANFNQIINNPVALWSPAQAPMNFNGQTMTLDAAGVTTVTSSASQAWNFTTGAKTGTPSSTGGFVNYSASTYTDSATAGSGTATQWSGFAIQRPTLAASNTGVTTTDAASFYVANAPAAGTNETLTNAWAIHVGAGNVKFPGTGNNLGTITTGVWNGTVVGQKYGGTSQNAGFTATVAANALTITLTDVEGNAPSASTPVYVNMRSAAPTTPQPITLIRTSALTLVIPDTALLGTTNATTYRLWIGASTSDGTALDCLVIFNTQATTSLYTLPGEANQNSATAITTGSDSGGVLYGTVSTSSKPLKWLGYIEIQEATAGTWATAPSVIQFAGPGVPRSGDRFPPVHARYSTETSSTTNTPVDTGLTASIAPGNACNRVLVDVIVNGVGKSAADVAVSVTLTDGANTVLALMVDAASYTGTANQSNIASVAIQYLDAPNSTNSKTYKARFFSKTNNATAYVQFTSAVSSITLQEIFP